MFELRPLQERGVQKALARGGRLGLLMDMGLGKTPTADKITAQLGCNRIVVVCGRSGIAVWENIGKQWLEQFSGSKVRTITLDDNPWNRTLDWNQSPQQGEILLFIVVYGTLMRDVGIGKGAAYNIPKKMQFDILICDECHRAESRDSKAASALEQFQRNHKIPYLLLLTGTPGDKGPGSFYQYLRLLDPKRFPSYWDFVARYCIVEKNFWGGYEVIEQREDTKEEWKLLLDKYFHIVTEEDAKGERPPLTRQKVYAKMTKGQEKLYNDLRKEMLHFFTHNENLELVVAENALSLIIRLRQALICPKVLNEHLDVGGAIVQLVDTLEDTNYQKPTVIFCPFTDPFPHWELYLRSRNRPIFMLQGGITVQQQQERIRSWQSTSGAIMLNSIDYAEAYELPPADNCWFIGSSWKPDRNRQAEKRLHRLTTTYPITSNYFTYGTPTDERIVDILNMKQDRIDTSYRKLLSIFQDEQPNGN